MTETAGNLFTSEDIEDIVHSLQEDLGSDDQNVFQVKVTAMQRMLRHGMSKFNKEKLYQHLCIIARRVSVQDRNRTLDVTRQAVLRSASHLREVIQDLNGKDKFNGLLESERQAIRFFQHFFIDIDHLKEFKEAYDREVHTVLYYSYYQPPNATKSKGDEDSGNYSLSELDEKHEQAKRLKVPKGGNSPRQGTSSRGDNSPRTKTEDNLSHVGFSFSKHLDGSEREKLDVTVQELSEVSERFDRLLHAEEQDLQDYDPESYYEVLECPDHRKFETVFRLIPDIFAKCYKVIELTKQWWTLAHIIYKTLPLGRPVSRAWPRRPVESHRSAKEEECNSHEQSNDELNEKPESVRSSLERNDKVSIRSNSEKEDDHRYGSDREDEGVCLEVPEQVIHVPEPERQQKEDRIKSIKAQLFDLSYAITSLDEELSDYKVNLRQLDSRERRFQMLEILQSKVDANLEELQEKIRKLRAQRKVTAQKYSYTFRGTEKYFDYREKLRSMDKKLMTYDQEIQMLVYKQGVVAQDFMLEMEIRPNFIRSYDDLRGHILETEYRLKERQQEKQVLVDELEFLEPGGIARRSRRSDQGSVSGQSEISGLSGATGSSGLRSHQTNAEVSGQSQFGALREGPESNGPRSTYRTADLHKQPEIHRHSRANHQTSADVHPQPETYRSRANNQNISYKPNVQCDSRNSEDSEFQEVFSGLGRRYELVSSAPPVKTQLREKRKKEEASRIPVPLPPKSESPHRSVTTIDGSKLGFQDRSKFHSPRPPVAGKRKIRKYVPGRRAIKPVA